MTSTTEGVTNPASLEDRIPDPELRDAVRRVLSAWMRAPSAASHDEAEGRIITSLAHLTAVVYEPGRASQAEGRSP